jgi:hypothetical protein
MVELVLDYTTVDTSPQFAPEHFAWNPPEGGTDVAAARPRVEQTAAETPATRRRAADPTRTTREG